VFPTDDAAKKSVYLTIMQISKNGRKLDVAGQLYNQLYIYFEDRII